MAANARALTPTHTGNTAAAGPVAADTPTSLASSSSTAVLGSLAALPPPKDPNQLAPLVNITSLRDSASPKPFRGNLSPLASPRALTGAAALADQRQLREMRKRSAEPDAHAHQMSPNPGVAAVQSLLGNQMSSPRDAPAAVANMSEPLEKAAKSIKIPENGTQDPAQTSPVSMSSLGSLDSTTAATTTAMDVTSGPESLSMAGSGEVLTPASSSHHQEHKDASVNDSGHRAFTFPPPLDQDPRSTPQRGMSLPVPYAHQQSTPSTRSPSMSGSSAKRHKCPYCSTDFTRHHNLKSHLLTHSQEKPYECKECNARFRRLHDLKRHTKLHTGERPHTCPKCGRRFARGDALARHNKGAGGCAGGRGSFGAPGMGDDGEDMDGLEYSNQQTEEPERMDDDEVMGEAGDRRRSEPGRDGQGRRGVTASTYPPIQGAAAGGMARDRARGMYPPPSGTTSTQSSYHRDSSGPQPSQTGISGSGSHGPGPLHFPPESARQVLGQTGMTESPKPLSPGQDAQRGSLSGGGLGSYPRPPGGGPNSNAPTLPSLAGLSSHPPSSLHTGMPGPPPMVGGGSNPSSHSSHGRSSAGSMREILGNAQAAPPGGQQQPSSEIYGFIRELEVRMARMQDEYEARISSLQQELSVMREHVRATGGGQREQQPGAPLTGGGGAAPSPAQQPR